MDTINGFHPGQFRSFSTGPTVFDPVAGTFMDASSPVHVSLVSSWVLLTPLVSFFSMRLHHIYVVFSKNIDPHDSDSLDIWLPEE